MCSMLACRTFWEKATILHQEHFRDKGRKAPERFARHYYDLFKMAASKKTRISALGDPALLARVVAHKTTFFSCRWAQYDLAVPATLKLLPSETWADFLREDFEKMKEMFFIQPPTWDDILDGLRALDADIRKMN